MELDLLAIKVRLVLQEFRVRLVILEIRVGLVALDQPDPKAAQPVQLDLQGRLVPRG